MSGTLKQIARRIGVSPTTVSRALRGVGRMSTDTRQAIRQAAQELGHPSASGILARPAVARGHGEFSPRLLMPLIRVSQEVDYEFQAREGSVTQGLRRRLALCHGELVAAVFDHVDEVVERFEQDRFAGIVLATQMPTCWIQKLRPLGPIVMAAPHDHLYGSNVSCVSVNEHRAASMLLDHLWQHGHRNVAWFGILDGGVLTDRAAEAVNPLLANDRLISTSHALRYGAWANHTISLQNRYAMPQVLVRRDHRHQSLRQVIEEGLCEILELRPQPTAVGVATSCMAAELYNVARSWGLSIPNDLSVVTYRDDDDHIDPPPRLTAVEINKERIGRVAVELIERQLAMPDSVAVTVQIEPTLRLGDSVTDLSNRSAV